MKFGGTSVADAERIRAVAAIVGARHARRPVVVVSALAGVTDQLERALAAARADDVDALEGLVADLERRHRWAAASGTESGLAYDLRLELDAEFERLRQRLRSMRVLGERSQRAADALLAWGDRLAARIVARTFRDRGVPAEHVDAREVLVTDGRFGAAEPELVATRSRCLTRIAPLVDAGRVPVLAGYVGATVDGETTTLGRGGSDTSAAVLGLALEVEEIQIWTDVDGVMTADPRRVPEARTLARVSFQDAAELACAGARVLHPASIAPAVRRRIPVRVVNSLRPDAPGTLIEGAGPEAAYAPLTGLTSRSPVRVLRLTSRSLRPGGEFRERAWRTFAALDPPPELVCVSEVSATAVAHAADALVAGTADWAAVEALDGRALVTAVGEGLLEGATRARVLEAFAIWEPDVVFAGGTGRSVSAALPEARQDEVLRALHGRFLAGVAA